MRARVHKEELAGLGSSGAAMKISIPSRASSLLQPGGVRVVGERGDSPTRRWPRSNKQAMAIPRCARLQGP